MIHQEHIINLGQFVFDDNNQQRKSWACLGQSCSRSLFVFLSQLFVVLLIIFSCFWKIHISKTCDENIVWVGICVVQQDAFYRHQDYEKVTSYKKNRAFISLVGPSETGKLQLFYNWFTNGTFQPKFEKFTFCTNILRHFMMLCKKRLKISSLFKVKFLNI